MIVLAVVLAILLSAGDCSLVVTDQEGAFPVCYLSTAYVNVTGLIGVSPGRREELLKSVKITPENVTEEVSLPAQLWAVGNMPGGTWVDVMFNGTTQRIIMGCENVTDVRTTTFLGCDSIFCTATGYPASACTGSSYINGTTSNQCGPIQDALSSGNYKFTVNSAGFEVATLTVTAPENGTDCLNARSWNHHCTGTFTGWSDFEGKACDDSPMSGVTVTNRAQMIAAFCEGGVWDFPEYLIPYFTLDGANKVRFCGCLANNKAVINLAGPEVPLNMLGTQTTGKVSSIEAMRTCENCQSFQFFGFQNQTSCEASYCKHWAISVHTSHNFSLPEGIEILSGGFHIRRANLTESFSGSCTINGGYDGEEYDFSESGHTCTVEDMTQVCAAAHGFSSCAAATSVSPSHTGFYATCTAVVSGNCVRSLSVREFRGVLLASSPSPLVLINGTLTTLPSHWVTHRHNLRSSGIVRGGNHSMSGNGMGVMQPLQNQGKQTQVVLTAIDHVPMESMLLGANFFRYPGGFDRVLIWTNFTVTWNTSLEENVDGIFDFVGDLANDLFGIATEDQISDMVAAAEASLKASKEALSLIHDLAGEVGVLASAMQHTIDEFYHEIVDIRYSLLELREADYEMARVSTANFRSLRSNIIANMIRENFETGAIWGNLYGSLLSLLQSDLVDLNDPFANQVMQIIQDNLAGEGHVGTKGPGPDVYPLMKKQLIKLNEASWLVYGVPVCTNATIEVHTVNLVHSPITIAGRPFGSSIPAEMKPVGSCMKALLGYWPSHRVFKQGAQRFVDGQGFGTVQSTVSFDECVAQLVQGDITLIGDLSGAGNSTRRLYDLRDLDTSVWSPQNRTYALISLGPCQYSLISDPSLKIVYHRSGMGLVPAKGNDLIMLQEGARVTLTSVENIPGLPITIKCRPGEQVAAILTGAQPGWIETMVRTSTLDPLLYPSDILKPELKYRNATEGSISYLLQEVDSVKDNVVQIQEDAEEAIREAEKAQADLDAYKNGQCDFWALKNCSVIKQFLAVCIYIAMIVGFLFLLSALSKSFGGKGKSSLVIAIMLGLGSAQIIGDPTTIGSNSSTTTTALASTTTQPATTTTTAAITTTTQDDSCPTSFNTWGGRMTVQEMAGYCCYVPTHPCTVLDWTDCSDSQRAYNVMFWMSVSACIILLVRAVVLFAIGSATCLSEAALVSLVKSVSEEWNETASPSYDFFCTSSKCTGTKFLFSARVKKLRSAMDSAWLGVVPCNTKVHQTVCGNCSTSWGEQVALFEHAEWTCRLNPLIGVKVNGVVSMLKDVMENIKPARGVLSEEEAQTYNLAKPEIRQRLPSGRVMSLLTAATLPTYASATIWRDGCELRDFSGPCCTTNEVTEFIATWVLITMVIVTALLCSVRNLWRIKRAAQKTKTAFVKVLARSYRSAGTTALTLGVIASQIGSAKAAVAPNFQLLDDPNCKWDEFDSCTAGHKIVFLIVTMIGAVFTVGLLMVTYRLLGCLKAVTKCLSWKGKQQIEDEDLRKSIQKLATLISSAGK